MNNVALSNMLDTPGLHFAAILDSSGDVSELEGVAGVMLNPALLEAVRSMTNTLHQAVQTGDLQDLLIELDGGPVLFTPYGTNTLVAGFDEVSNLGRIRFAAKRAISRLK